MSSKSRHDHADRKGTAARRALASLPGPVRQQLGARPTPPERPAMPDLPQPPEPPADVHPMTIDERLAQAKGNVEQLDKYLGQLKKKAEEVEAQLLKALGAYEILVELKRDGYHAVDSPTASDAPQSPEGEGDTDIPPGPPPSTEGDPPGPGEGESDAVEEEV